MRRDDGLTATAVASQGALIARGGAAVLPDKNPVTVFIGVGSNIEPAFHVATSLDRLAEELDDFRSAPWYRSPSVGFIGDPFINTVCAGMTWRDLPGLIDRLRAIEAALGRERDTAGSAPRTIDLDLLFYGARVQRGNGIELPRDEIHQYAFVLQPLADIAWTLVHPVSGVRIGDLLLEQRHSEPARFEVLERINAGRESVLRPPPGLVR